jgi:hypothetical protein
VATDDVLAEVSTIHESPHAETRERLAALFDVVTRAAAEKHLEPVLAYTDELGGPDSTLATIWRAADGGQCVGGAALACRS